MTINMLDFRIALPITAVSGSPKLLPVPFRRSALREWCWAACAQMVFLQVLPKLVKQCCIAKIIKGSTCCDDPQSCNAPCDVADVGTVFTAWAVKFDPPKGQIGFDVLEKEIDPGKRPVEAGYCDGSTGHLVIFRGTHDDGTTKWVYYNDPASGQGKKTWAEVLKNQDWGTWKYTWTGIEK